MKLLLLAVIIALHASFAFAADPPLTSDIADLGKININGRQVPFFEISGTSDIPVSPDAQPNNLPTSIAQDHTRQYGLDSENNLTAPIAIFAQLAINGVDAAIGFLSQAAIDLKNAYDNGILQAESPINDVIKQTFPAPLTVPAVNDVFNSSGINDTCTFTGNKLVTGSATFTGISWPKTSGGQNYVYCTPTQITFFHGETENTSYWFGHKHVINVASTSNPINFSPTGAPASLDDSQEAQLAAALKNALATNAALLDALDRTIKNNSSLLGSQPSVTSADVQSFAAKAVADANQGLIDSLTQKLAANPNDGALQAALEKAKADAAKDAVKDLEDTYGAVVPSGFNSPYSPGQGEYDIPARFTSFLNNVKSSGLFSFSSGFFNSLPDGGSPVYEIEGGQTFGHHTIDLSQNLSTGLAVLKTILLACFGFLSIRAIIMKR